MICPANNKECSVGSDCGIYEKCAVRPYQIGDMVRYAPALLTSLHADRSMSYRRGEVIDVQHYSACPSVVQVQWTEAAGEVSKVLATNLALVRPADGRAA